MKSLKAVVAVALSAAAFSACDQNPVEAERDPHFTFSPDSVVIRIYDSSPLTVIVRDASGEVQYGTLDFVSRDPSVASVNANGTISALAVGSTYVVTTFADLPEVRDSVKVRVYAEEIPISGAAVPGMESYDLAVADVMRKYELPGGAVAVLRDGKLIYARGFGYANVENKTPVQPDALFRIASLSKSITSAAIMRLIEDGEFELDDRVAPFIAHLTPAPGATVDPRWKLITIRQLLNHTGGWDRTKPGGFEPMDRHAIAAAAVGAPAPASAETIIRYMKGLPLDFTPGEKYVYSNLGYAILGRVIESVSGMPYEEFVRAHVLEPVGANRTVQGRTRMRDAHSDEVTYYLPGQPGLGLTAPMVQSVFPGEGSAPIPYGAFHIESFDASGAWVSSTVDLLRFLTGVDGRTNRPDILSAATIAEMTSNGPTVCAKGECYYAGGWLVRPTLGDATWSHGGALPGTTSLIVRSYHNFSWVALFNARAGVPGFDAAVDAALWNALGQVTSFPTHDLFTTFR